MDITAPRKELLRALVATKRVTARQTTLPILKQVRLRAADGQAHFFANNLDTSLEVSIAAEVRAAGVVVVPIDTLQPLMSGLPEAPIDLRADGKHGIVVGVGFADYQCSGPDPADFPEAHGVGGEPVKVTLPAEILKEMLRQVVFAADEDGARAVLQGVLFHIQPGQLSLAATDTHRLALRREQIPHEAGDAGAIIPAIAIKELLGILTEGEVELEIGTNQTAFRMPGMLFTTTLIGGQFPRYERVVPTGGHRICVTRQALIDAVHRVRIVVGKNEADNDKNPVVTRVDLEAKGDTLEVSGVGRNEGDARRAIERLPLLSPISTQPQGFNALFLLQALRSIPDESVILAAEGPLSPVAVRPVSDLDLLQVVMPIRI